LKFASALQERYTERDWLNPLNRFILQMPRIGTTIQHLHRQQQISIAPNLALTVLKWMTPSVNADHTIPAPTLPHLRHQRETQLLKTVTQKRETHLLEQVVEQIIAHKKRVEVTSQPSFTGSSVSQVPDIKRVVRQTIPPKTDQTLISPETKQGFEGKRQENKTAHEMYREPDMPININRLTDQIIQTIDRRIIAQRERLGRV
jgi:hypothetical protein